MRCDWLSAQSRSDAGAPLSPAAAMFLHQDVQIILKRKSFGTRCG
jgi:hypothetical protein